MSKTTAFWVSPATRHPPRGPPSYQEKGLEAFLELLTTRGHLQRDADPADRPVRIAVVTTRNRPAHERMIRTLRAWGVQVDSAFFMGGVPKDEVLKTFKAHIFFDDQEVHLGLASAVVPSARVPYRTRPDADAASATARRDGD